MTDQPNPPATSDDAWGPLRQHTAARIGQARSGASLATAPLLAFRLAHARARDAVHAPLDEARLTSDLESLGLPIVKVSSAAEDRRQYLMRPDLGRTLAPGTAHALAPHAGESCDVVFVIADGLSARAVQDHAARLLGEIVPDLTGRSWTIAPLVIVRRGRVAIGDAIAGMLKARITVVLIGERPGLSSPDSMGAYVTWQTGAPVTDADRNCISNIRPDGLRYADAGFTLVHLLRAMRAQGRSGVRLKNDADRLRIEK